MALLFDRPVPTATIVASHAPGSPRPSGSGAVSPFDIGDIGAASRAPSRGLQSPFDTTSGVRLALASTFGNGPLDGAWWPRSTDLSAQIEPLVDAVNAAVVGRVTRLTYDRRRWGPVPRRLPYRGRHIKNGWFDMTDPHQMALTLLSGTRLVLLVIPPDLAAEQAVWALHRAVEASNTLGPLQILRQARSAAYEEALQRWVDEGGQAGRPHPGQLTGR